jgi:hypothetical protein
MFMNSTRNPLAVFTAAAAGGPITARLARVFCLAAAVAAMVVPTPGCGPAPAAPGTVIKDPPPLAPEETTEALLQKKLKPKPRAARR